MTNLLEDGVEDVEVVVEVDAVGRRQLLVVVRLPLLEDVELHGQVRVLGVLLPAHTQSTHVTESAHRAARLAVSVKVSAIKTGVHMLTFAMIIQVIMQDSYSISQYPAKETERLSIIH